MQFKKEIFIMERNELCWCGSGKKYKKCHMQIDDKILLLASEGHIVPDRGMLKTPAQIEEIKKVQRSTWRFLITLQNIFTQGWAPYEIDKLVYDYTTEHGGIPAPLGYDGFSKKCMHFHQQRVCHGIPDENIILEEGDIINVDVSTILNGYYSDASRMFAIGELSDRAEKDSKSNRRMCRTWSCSNKTLGASRGYCRCNQLTRSGKRLLCGWRHRRSRNRSCISRRTFCELCHWKEPRWFLFREWCSPSNRWSTKEVPISL